MTETKETTKPKNKFRLGALTITVWENTFKVDGNEVTSLSYQLERNYKDKNDEWKTTNSFSRNDLSLLLPLISHALAEMNVKSE